MSNDKLSIIATLNIGKSIGEINTAIKGLEKKVNKLKLNIEVDPKVLGKLETFGKQLQKISSDALNPNKIVEEQWMPDGSKIKRTFNDGYGGAFQDIKRQAHETAKSQINNQDQVTKATINSYQTMLKEHQKYNEQVKLTNKSLTSMSDDKKVTRTINYDGQGALKGYTDVIDHNKEARELELANQRKIRATEKFRVELKRLYDQGTITEQRFNRFNNVVNNVKNVQQVERLTTMLKQQEQVAVNTQNKLKLISDASALEKTRSKTVDLTALKNLQKELAGIDPKSKNAANSIATLQRQLRNLNTEAKSVTHQSMSMMDMFSTAMTKFPIDNQVG